MDKRSQRLFGQRFVACSADQQRKLLTALIQSQIGDEWNAKFFVNDRENPYTTDADKPYLFLRGRHVGGRSVMWGRQTYRWSDLDSKRIRKKD